MLNHITIMGRMVRDPELRRTEAALLLPDLLLPLTGTSKAAVPTRKRSTLSTALPGVRPESSSVSILPVAIWQLCPADCRSAAGMTRMAISAVLLRWSPTMFTSAIPRATALPPVPRQLLLQTTAPLRILYPIIWLRIFRCWRMTMLSCRFKLNRGGQP